MSAAAAFGPQVLGDTLTLLDGEEDEFINVTADQGEVELLGVVVNTLDPLTTATVVEDYPDVTIRSPGHHDDDEIAELGGAREVQKNIIAKSVLGL